jgi:hypothetical protein
MAKNKPKETIEYVIRLQDKERQLLEDFLGSYRIQAMTGTDSVVEVLADAGKVTAALGTIGAILELLGITDVFDFDDEAKALIIPIKERIKDKIEEKVKDPSFLAEFLFKTSPFGAPFVAADIVRDRI